MYPVRLVLKGKTRPADEVARALQRHEDERHESPDEVRAMVTPEVGVKRARPYGLRRDDGDDDSVVETPGGLFGRLGRLDFLDGRIPISR